ncbi:MAG: peptidylprolyl isomerase [Bacteroidota bacterium]
MKIEKNKVVSLTYRLTETDANGTLIEEVDAKQPFVFLFGSGNLIPGFETNVNHLQLGDAFAFSVAAADAYGDYDVEGVTKVPITIFQNEGVLDTEVCKVGNIVPMRNDQGQQFNGIIKAVDANDVTMDFNHPLAGKNLHFKGSVVDVREATAEELKQGHFHPEGCHQGADGCSDSSCGCGCE